MHYLVRIREPIFVAHEGDVAATFPMDSVARSDNGVGILSQHDVTRTKGPVSQTGVLVRQFAANFDRASLGVDVGANPGHFTGARMIIAIGLNDNGLADGNSPRLL